MSQALSDVVSLVDQSVIAAAKANHDAKVQQLATAQAQVTTAASNSSAAQASLTAAAQGKGSVSLGDAATAIEDTDRALKIAKMVEQAATQAVADAVDAQRVAEGKAWQPVYLAGARQRLAAAQAGDAARTALAAAETAYAEANKMLDAASSHGTLGVEAVQVASPQLRTVADETKLWSSNGFDPVAGTYPVQWN